MTEQLDDVHELFQRMTVGYTPVLDLDYVTRAAEHKRARVLAKAGGAVAIVLVASAAFVGVSVTHHRAAPAPASLGDQSLVTPRALAGTPVQTTSVVIDPRLWTYGPPSANTATPATTAVRDFDQYTGRDAIPAGTSVTIGLLTGKTLDGGVTQATLVYGYSDYEPKCPDFGPGGPSDAKGCTGWTFLDANTGKQILSTWTLN